MKHTDKVRDLCMHAELASGSHHRSTTGYITLCQVMLHDIFFILHIIKTNKKLQITKHTINKYISIYVHIKAAEVPGHTRDLCRQSSSRTSRGHICRASAPAAASQRGSRDWVSAWYMGSYKWGYKSPNMGYNHGYLLMTPLIIPMNLRFSFDSTATDATGSPPARPSGQLPQTGPCKGKDGKEASKRT